MMSARIADGWAYWDEFLYWKHFNKGIGLKEKKKLFQNSLKPEITETT